MKLALYRAAGVLAAPFIRATLRMRTELGKEDPKRINERFGQTLRTRPDGPLAWVNAASIGESLSVVPLIERLIANWPALNVLLTRGTVTSATLMTERLPEGAGRLRRLVERSTSARRYWKARRTAATASLVWSPIGCVRR